MSILYKREEAWGLPSLSPGCIQAEALLRFSGEEFSVVVRHEPGFSPTSFHPCFEKDQKLASAEKCVTEFDCVRQIHDYLKSTNADADAALNLSQSAMAAALTTLIQQELEPATLYAMWCDAGFKKYKSAFGGRLVTPLNYIVAKTEQRKIQKVFAGHTADEIYRRAAVALDRISHILGDRNEYLFGKVPCSADAYVYGHLLFYRLSPVTPPSLQKKLTELDNVTTYVERTSKNNFANAAPALESVKLPDDSEDEEMTSAWSNMAPSGNLWSAQKLWDELQKMDKMSRWWLGGAVSLLLAYAWIHPPFVIVVDHDGSLGEEDEEET